MEFKISSALKDHIGKELITDDNVAILELVKNSYDAGAKKVKIIFEDLRSENSKIYVIDNGKGMSREHIEKKWLFLGYSEKKDFEKYLKSRDKKKRIMAGAKGIGRFSCDRLGSKLKIITKMEKDKNFNIIELDWKDFEKDQEKEFQSIPVKISNTKILERGFDVIKNSGTIIEISSLRNEWDRKKILELKRYLQRLINPLQVPKGDNFEIFLDVSDFSIQDQKEAFDYDKVNGVVRNKVYEDIGFKTTTIDCEISEDGEVVKTLFNDKGVDIFELKEENKKYKLLKNIKVKLSFLNTESKKTFKRLMGVYATDYGNVFLFKNGFRILPYGERDDDWLKLNDRKTQGYNRYLGTRELLGRIEVNGYQSEFREVTSRTGGLIETNSFLQLRKFIIFFVLPRLEKYVVGAIDWDSPREGNKKDFELIKKDTREIIEQIAGSLENKDLTYNKDFLEIVEKKTIEKIPETIKNIEDIIKKEKDKEIKDLYLQQLQSLKLGIKLQKQVQEEKTEEAERKQKEAERKYYFEKGRDIDKAKFQEILHSIKIFSNKIKSSLELINTKVENDEFLKARLAHLKLSNDKILLITEVATGANFNLLSKKGKYDIFQFLSEYINNYYSNIFKDIKIKINKPSEEVSYYFSPLDFMTLFDNFYQNSKNARARNIVLNLTSEKDKFFITIEDDGKGIEEKDVPKLFTLGFTTTSGSGIGLYHIRSILEKDYNAKITLSDRKKAKFIMEFKK
jgi:signal transduction histidine kinase